jgi:transaldolase
MKKIMTKNQLEALREMSTVVADTGEVALIGKYRPIDATTNPSLILKAIGLDTYKPFLSEAIDTFISSGAHPTDPLRPYADIVDHLLVRFAEEITRIVPGRVSLECDAHLSYDTAGTVAKARRLIALCAARGIDKKRIYIKIASTWEGIRACEILQKEGIDCNMTLLFSFAQAVAAAEAGAALISPFVGRILDWYKKRDGEGVYGLTNDPGVASVRRIYRYYKKYGFKTVVMAASFRNVGEIHQLAGCDNITIAPQLLGELEASVEPLSRKLVETQSAQECTDPKITLATPDEFYALHSADQMAVDKLQEGIEAFAKDQDALEKLIGTIHAA